MNRDKQFRTSYEGTSTNVEDAGEGLTLDGLLTVIKQLRDLPPRMLFRVSEFMPVTTEDGKPAIFRVKESALSPGFFRKRGFSEREVVLLHPDNFEILQKRCQGLYVLEEFWP